jgi:hypothetical protein
MAGLQAAALRAAGQCAYASPVVSELRPPRHSCSPETARACGKQAAWLHAAWLQAAGYRRRCGHHYSPRSPPHHSRQRVADRHSAMLAPNTNAGREHNARLDVVRVWSVPLVLAPRSLVANVPDRAASAPRPASFIVLIDGWRHCRLAAGDAARFTAATRGLRGGWRAELAMAPRRPAGNRRWHCRLVASSSLPTLQAEACGERV